MITGDVELRLAKGPVWHYPYIRKLAPELVKFMVEELGEEEVLKKFSDPLWFQTFSSLMGFEWQFSGATTVTLRAISEGLPLDFPLRVIAAKGKIDIPEEFSHQIRKIIKFDSAAFQDGYDPYFFSILYTDKNFVVINQGMNVRERLARRYHWINETEKPMGRKEKAALVFNENNRELKDTIVDIVNDMSPHSISRTVIRLSKTYEGQTTLDGKRIDLPYYLKIPKRVEEKALEIAKGVSSFEELFMMEGIGKSTLRALAYIAYLIYDTPVSWEDPVLYTYAFGTKVGVPYLVRTDLMDEVTNFIEKVRLEDKEKRFLLKHLYRLMKHVRSTDSEGGVRSVNIIRKDKAQSGR